MSDNRHKQAYSPGVARALPQSLQTTLHRQLLPEHMSHVRARHSFNASIAGPDPIRDISMAPAQKYRVYALKRYSATVAGLHVRSHQMRMQHVRQQVKCPLP
eukprot:TRINITY_DN12376_c0_g1_i2.p1 TRINITY_DN12376_c0_g1~~TRINITY_DN12376_c0_g1_i2.p1  ORF type:complete len:102 (-),score=6.84 TRINITY_DN12376_c0_g1_i2:536-841(-)